MLKIPLSCNLFMISLFLLIDETKESLLTSKTMLSRALKTICVNSGMSREYSLHELRHTAITRLCEEGISTQDLVPLVGHSDPVMINTIYNSFQNEASLEKKESIKKFF